MAVRYEPDLLEKFAGKLYGQANIILILAIVICFFICFGLGYFSTEEFSIISILAGILGGLIGFGIGNSMAFKLKADAQIILVQLQIERNTRHHDSAAKDEEE